MGISMTQENKDLLLKDLCARLPYGVKINNEIQGDFVLYGVCENYIFARSANKHGWINHADFNIEKIKPYLFPLSSMTDEQKEEIDDKLIFPNNSNGGWIEILYNDKYKIPFWFVDFCNKNHLDYIGLIPKGLAIDATGKNIY